MLGLAPLGWPTWAPGLSFHLLQMGGIDFVERTDRLHRHWTLWQGQGNRGPRHLASRHLTHFNWHEFVELNPDRKEELTKTLDEFAVRRGALEKIRETHQGPIESNRRCIGGNPKITFLNAWLHSCSLLKELTEESVIAERAKAVTVWETTYKHDPGKYMQWYWRYRQELETRRQAKILNDFDNENAALNEPEEAEYLSPWSAGSGNLPTSAALVDQDLRSAYRSDAIALRTNCRCVAMRNEEQYLVRNTEANAVEVDDLEPDDWGCLHLTRNICVTDNAVRSRPIELCHCSRSPFFLFSYVRIFGSVRIC